MKAVILLSCEGRQDNGFIFCRGAENIVLDLEKHRYSENYPLLLEYIEKTVKLYNGPCCLNNVIMNALYKFHQYEYLNEAQYNYIIHFAKMHKFCGLILKMKVEDG